MSSLMLSDSPRASPSPQPWREMEPDSYSLSPEPATGHLSPDVNPKLIIPSSPRHRHFRQPTLQPLNQQPLQAPQNDFAISASNNNTYNFSRQDVPPQPVNASSTAQQPNNTSSPVYNVYSSLTSPLSSIPVPSSHHVSLNTNQSRLRTSTQVFSNTHDLAAHYGIPQFLPPAPSTVPRRPSQHEATETHTSPTSPVFDFESMRSNYLNMLAQKPEDPPVVGDPQAMVPAVPPEETIQALVDTLKASPEFQSMDSFNDFLTSPFDDTPFDEFLTTPEMPSADMGDFMTSPAIADSFDDSFDLELPLFGHGGVDVGMDESKPELPTHAQPDFNGLITISPDDSPLIDPSSLDPYTVEKPTTPRRRSMATGIRKNVTPSSLVPLEAPTQARHYVSPSATSRKEIPATFARKRARSQAFGDEEDQLEEIALPPNPTEAQIIEAKRRQNTIAARRSRKRKLEYTRDLEDKVEILTQEKDMWKSRAITCEALLKSHGLSVPERS